MLKKVGTVPDYKARRRPEPQHRSQADETYRTGQDPHRLRVTQTTSRIGPAQLRSAVAVFHERGGRGSSGTSENKNVWLSPFPPLTRSDDSDWRRVAWKCCNPSLPDHRTGSKSYPVAEGSHEQQISGWRYTGPEGPYLFPRTERNRRRQNHPDEPKDVYHSL